ncbi:MAG: ParA family protein [Leptospiraceae bacterium]|nr:ParA family protein [Leptospiraceae bacterium]
MSSGAHILCVANQKGGVGKTTSALNLAHSLVRQSRRVLLVDLDAQANSTSVLMADESIAPEQSVYVVFKDKHKADPLILTGRIAGLDLLGAHLKLAEVETLLAGAVDGFFRLADALQDCRERYDCIILDCPPNLGMLTVNAFVAANSLLVPLQTAKFSLDGLTAILDTATTIQGRFNPGFRVLGALLTMHNARTAISQAFIEPIAEYIHLFQSRISRAVAVEEAHMMHQTIFEYQPGSKVALEYETLGQEVWDAIQEG